jgi:hypothetical protein
MGVRTINMKVKLQVGQIYEVINEVGENIEKEIIYLPNKTTNIIATRDSEGMEKFYDRGVVVKCIKLGLWKLKEE